MPKDSHATDRPDHELLPERTSSCMPLVTCLINMGGQYAPLPSCPSCCVSHQNWQALGVELAHVLTGVVCIEGLTPRRMRQGQHLREPKATELPGSYTRDRSCKACGQSQALHSIIMRPRLAIHEWRRWSDGCRDGHLLEQVEGLCDVEGLQLSRCSVFERMSVQDAPIHPEQ